MPGFCKHCEGWGVVAPLVIQVDPPMSWPAWLDQAVQVQREQGYPIAASATAAGLIKPVPCPSCRGVKTRPKHQVLPFLQFADADGRATSFEDAVHMVVCRPAAVPEETAKRLVAGGLAFGGEHPA